MTYGSGSSSTPPAHDDGGEQYDSTAPVYEDIDLGVKEEHVTPSPPTTTSRGLFVYRRSHSIEKKHRKNKQVYKSDVVIQIWQKAFINSKRSGYAFTADSLDNLFICQDILESMQLPDERYVATLQLFVKEPYQKLFINMKPKRRSGFLNTVVPMPPYIPHPPPPSDF